MKLVLQIAAGILIAYFAIRAIELATLGAVLNRFSHELPKVPRTQPHVEYPTEQAPADVTRGQTPQKWTITTTDGKTYSGAGAPPPGGLRQQAPEQR